MSDLGASAPARIAFLGDAAEAAAFRLCGLQTWSPEAGGELAALNAALAQAALVLLSASLARRLPAAALEAALQRLAPPTLIIPEPEGSPLDIDPVVRVRHHMSLEVQSDRRTSAADGNAAATSSK